MATARSQPFRIRVVAAVEDGTTWVTSPATYRGDESFVALGALVAEIPATGGWRQLAGTRISDVLVTAEVVQTIHPGPGMMGVEGPDALTRIWPTAAWNGYGFFLGACGSHYAYSGNDYYMVRVADPVGAFRLHDPAPAMAVSNRGLAEYAAGELLPPAIWPETDVYEGTLWPAWGPFADHQYGGLLWHAATEQLIDLGDQMLTITNPTEVGRIAQIVHGPFVLDPFAPTPRSAWSFHQMSAGEEPGGWPGDQGGYAGVENADGTISFRSRSTVHTFDPVTKALEVGSPGPGPRQDSYTFWRTCFRDPSTDRYFELKRNGATLELLEDAASGQTVVAELPADLSSSADDDDHPGVVARNGYAYFWAGKTSSVHRVSLADGTIETWRDESAIVPANATGLWGRWAYVPEARCFVGITTHETEVYVFRPPATWGEI